MPTSSTLLLRFEGLFWTKNTDFKYVAVIYFWTYWSIQRQTDIASISPSFQHQNDAVLINYQMFDYVFRFSTSSEPSYSWDKECNIRLFWRAKTFQYFCMSLLYISFQFLLLFVEALTLQSSVFLSFLYLVESGYKEQWGGNWL